MGDFFESSGTQMIDPALSAVATGDVSAGDPFDLTGMKGQARAIAMQQEQNRLEREIRQRLRDEARADLMAQFPQAREDIITGSEQAQQMLSGSLPSELAAMQAGNVAAQQVLAAGLPQFESALLGGGVQQSFQPQAFAFDTSFLNQPQPALPAPQQSVANALAGNQVAQDTPQALPQGVAPQGAQADEDLAALIARLGNVTAMRGF